MFMRVVNFLLTNPILLIIILGGIFNVTVRIAQKMKEQRARRDALHEMARRKQEALRTGRSVAEPESSAISPAPVHDAQAQRRERIEALRQERMEQLRALREKRARSSSGSGQPTASPARVSQNHPNMPPIPVQEHPQQPQSPRPPTPHQQPQSRPQSRPQPRPQQSTQPPRHRQVVATSQQAQSTRRRADQVQSQESRSQTMRQSKLQSKPQERSAGNIETVRGASRSARPHLSKPEQTRTVGSARSMLRSRTSLKQAMVLREILDTPIALRDQDIASGSLFS